MACIILKFIFEELSIDIDQIISEIGEICIESMYERAKFRHLVTTVTPAKSFQQRSTNPTPVCANELN